MPLRVESDGKIVRLRSSATLAYVGQAFADGDVSDDYLERVKAGLVPGLSYHEEDEPVEESKKEEPPPTDSYDPSVHNQDDVLAYLATADEDEVERVKAAEKQGKGRQKIVGYEAAGGDS